MNKHLQPTHLTSYDADYFLWSQRQAELIRKLKIEGLDAENVAEEIESLGRSDRRELSSRLEILLEHLIKWQFQQEKRSNSWRASIREARKKSNVILDDSPSLRVFFRSQIEATYETARESAAEETGLDISAFPQACPYTEAQILDRNYLPD